MAIYAAGNSRGRAKRTGATLSALALALLLAGLPGPDGVQAATTASGAEEGQGGWVDTLAEPFETLSHWLSRQFSREERFIADEIEAFKHAVDTDLSAFDALVGQAGFRIASISVGSSLVPRVGLSLTFVRRLSEPEKAALMTRLTDAAQPVGTIQRSIIMTLLNAAESVYAMRGDGYRLTGVDIEVDAVPDVTFIMAKSP
jgi:hypothetical protein